MVARGGSAWLRGEGVHGCEGRECMVVRGGSAWL